MTRDLSSRAKLRAVHLPLVLLAGLLFLSASRLPVGSSKLWSHLHYGEWILAHGELPREDPFLPLAEGLPVTDSTWLAEVLLAFLHRIGGAEGLSVALAMVLVLTYLLLGRLFFLQTSSLLASLLAVVMALALTWSRTSALLPESFAAICLVALLRLLLGSRLVPRAGESSAVVPVALWLGVVPLVALWANLHPSFVLAPLLLASCFVDRVLEVGTRERRLLPVLRDRWVQRWLLASELAVLASLVNPYGYRLWFEVLQSLRDLESRGLPEGRPLVIAASSSWGYVLSLLFFMVVLRRSRSAVRPAQVLVLLVLGLAAASHIVILPWYAAIYACVVAPHLPGLLAEGRKALFGEPSATDEDEERWPQLMRRRSWSATLGALFLSAAVFLLSPAGAAVVPRNARDPLTLFGPTTPYYLALELEIHPPRGTTFVPGRWADWLLESNPGLEPMVTRNIRRVPIRVWGDYLKLSAGQAGWDDLLDRYAIETVVVDKARQEALGSLLRDSEAWRQTYEDAQAWIFRRVETDAQDRGEGE